MRTTTRHALFSLLLAAALLATGGCREDGPRMDVQLTVRLGHDALPAGGPLELTYLWQLAAGAEPVDFDCLVFAHFRSADGDIRWQDDHNPPLPTSRWRPGQTVEYTRITFIPDSVPLGQISMVAGLYDHQGTEEKVVLGRGSGAAPEYTAARFELLPAGQLPIVVYGEGWYDQESRPGERVGPTWRWCRQEAVCWAELPGRPCALFVEVQAPVEGLETAQSVTIEAEGTELASFKLDHPGRVVRRIPLPDRLTMGNDCIRLVVRTGKVARPPVGGGSAEARELGLKFYRLAVY